MQIPLSRLRLRLLKCQCLYRDRDRDFENANSFIETEIETKKIRGITVIETLGYQDPHFWIGHSLMFKQSILKMGFIDITLHFSLLIMTYHD